MTAPTGEARIDSAPNAEILRESRGMGPMNQELTFMPGDRTAASLSIAGLHCDTLCTGEMQARWRDHFNHPPLFNDLGCFRTGPDPMGVFNFMFPPFSGCGEGTALLYLDRRHPASCDVSVGYTWHPDRVRRRARFEGLEVETITRALPRDPGAMILLTLSNPAREPRSVEVGIRLAGRLKHTIDGWAGIGPHIGLEDELPETWAFDEQTGGLVFASGGRACQCQATVPRPDAVEGKTLLYNVSIPPGGRWQLRFVAALAETEEAARSLARHHLAHFDDSGAQALDLWNRRIQKAFQPGNDLYSGHLPALTTENEGLLRLYLMTTLGCLVLRRDNPLSVQGPVFVTLSPNYWTTASFVWDMMIAGPFFALLDPAVMRRHIEVWLAAGIQNCLATDYVTGRPLGYWYAVNSSAIVRLAWDYVRWTGDVAWLDRQVKGRPVIEHLEEHALLWRQYDRHGHGLADCGGVNNLLECVSTYTHEVAAFNAMWVAAQRQAAALRRVRGEAARAQRLEAGAAELLQNVMGLYAEGQGHWRCRQPDGSLRDVRHVYDFVAVLESIAEDLPPHVQREMVEYFRRHHYTPNWARSLSAWDDDAHRSLRVDHQWTGSYASICAQAINGLFRIGFGDMAFEWLERIASVAHQGPVGQAHWVEPLYPAYRGGAWKCSYTLPFMTDWTVSANGAYPAMIIESVFGVNATLDRGLRWRGAAAGLDPGARLENLRYQGRMYHVDRTGISPAD
ncbi:MAG: hypothetical protein Kow0059_11360 [Candidatus Sumerlaeia bacterium]